MPTTYEKCDRPMSNFCDRVMRQFHPELVNADVNICYLYASRKAGCGHALTHNGWPARAIIRITNLRDRVAGLADALLLLDRDKWPAGGLQQQALIDHELYHLEVVQGGSGPARDDSGRPILRMRPHDFQFGGFDEMVRRHGTAAMESIAYQSLSDRWAQGEFNFQTGGVVLPDGEVQFTPEGGFRILPTGGPTNGNGVSTAEHRRTGQNGQGPAN